MPLDLSVLESPTPKGLNFLVDLTLEVGRFVFMLSIVLFVAWIGWSRSLLGSWAWRFTLVAFLLLFFGAAIDVVDDYPVTVAFFGWHDTPVNTLLEKGVGYFGGFAFMFLAAWRWLPHSDTLTHEKSAAEEARKAAEEQRDVLRDQLIQAQKMEAIGALTGGIAHDFNNLLMVIDGYARRATSNIAKRAVVEESLKQVARASAQAAALTKQLLVFSRRQSMEKKVHRVSDLLSRVRDLLQHAVSDQHNLLFEFDAGTACIETDANEFCQTLLNLVINARDAMPNGGTITITSQLAAAVGSDGEHVTVSVADTGHGMDAKTAARIFEPFFTTKERGKGTGLGLSTAFGFVQASGGNIDVQTAPGAGTTMILRFPVSRQAATETARVITAAPRGRGEIILLVEDNEPVLELINESLTDLGYTVLPAPSGFEALEIASERDAAIDLLLTDVIMPGLSGIEVARVVRARRPDIKIIFMSGYTDATRKTGHMPHGAALLQKPVDMRRLAEVIHGELSGLTLSAVG